jgi:hypothetical protein
MNRLTGGAGGRGFPESLPQPARVALSTIKDRQADFMAKSVS